MTIDEMIAVLDAAKVGKRIEVMRLNLGSHMTWEDVVNPSWDFARYKYRVKPEPRRVWVVYSGECPLVTHSNEAAARAAVNATGCTVREFIEAQNL